MKFFFPSIFMPVVVLPTDFKTTLVLHISCIINIVLAQAEGTPDPEILWFKNEGPVQQSATVAVINDGTELRINSIR
jgi:hypothetical protein